MHPLSFSVPQDTASASLAMASPAPWRHVEVQDAHALSKCITGWNQDYDQISCGRFEGRLVEWRGQSLQLFIEHSSRALTQLCRLPDNRVWLGMPLASDRLGRMNGEVFGHGQVVQHAGGTDFLLNTSDDYAFAGFVLDVAVLQQQLLTVDPDSRSCALGPNGIFAIGTEQVQALTHWIYGFMQSAAHADGLPTAVERAALEALTELLLPTLNGGDNAFRDTVALQYRRKVFRRIEEHLKSCPSEPVTVGDLCLQFGISRRALQDCFQCLLGISPKHYLKARSLNGVRRTLLDPDSSLRTVQSVANHYGFWHMGQLSADYKALFGESPSDTLTWRARSAPGRA